MKKFYNTLITLKVGDRVVVPKSGVDWIQHHAIFLGYENGYFLFIENKDGFGVRVVNSETFFQDVVKITRVVRFIPSWGYNSKNLVRYALSKRGRAYHLTNYNCEHFANEVQHKIKNSKQADNFIALVFFGLLFLIVGALFSGSRKK